MRPVFISGIGTEVGKTLVAAIVTRALQADYWKPVQAGFNKTTDAETVKVLAGNNTVVIPEVYQLHMAASPHIAAREEDININLTEIEKAWQQIKSEKPLVIEGAGGLLVPLNKDDKVLDLIKILNAVVILVSRHYLGSINHSLMSATVCQLHRLDVAGWMFTDTYLSYENEIIEWSGFPSLGSIPFEKEINNEYIDRMAEKIRSNLMERLSSFQ
jgi:dethiobiotin synthetase